MEIIPTVVVGSQKRILGYEQKKSVDWIEALLQLPLAEHRKYCIWRILTPYFVNVKQMSFEDSYNRIYQWLQ
jgi:hypothetical protein